MTRTDPPKGARNVPMPPRPLKRAFAATIVIGALIVGAYATRTLAADTAGDAIYAVGEGGVLEPIAVRKNGTFIKPGSNDGGPSESLQKAAAAALAGAGNRVHVIFGGRVIATVPVTVDPNHAYAHITVPSSLHLAGHISAVASTLNGYAGPPRRAPTPDERRRALASAAAVLHTSEARVTVRNLTAIRLARRTALIGTVDLRGTDSPRTDKRLFFVDELVSKSAIAQTLHNVMTIKVTEPLLEEPAEYLVDTLDLGNDTPALITSIIGYDANTFAIYTRLKAGQMWTKIYEGGGAAM